MGEKLTPSQGELLDCLRRYETQRVTRNYSTARCLRERGLIAVEEVEPPYAWRCRITDAGRAALAAAREPEGAER